MDEEQPSPYSGFSTTSAPLRSTLARTSSAAPPSATTSWSKPQARAESSTWPSSVVPRYGSVCFGRPRRLEPPAASTRPATKSLSGRDIRLEAFPAPLAAEPHGAPVALDVRRGRCGRDLHPAHRVDRGAGSREGLPGAAGAHDLRQDRQCDLVGGLGADVEAGGRADARDVLLRERASRPQLVEHCGAAPAARDETDVGHAGAQCALERILLVAAVRGDHQGNVVVELVGGGDFVS